MLSKTLKDKIVILTGIGGGIGICAAERLMNNGAKLIGISSKKQHNMDGRLSAYCWDFTTKF